LLSEWSVPRVAFTKDEIEATTRRLSEAALRVFEREGYDAATMRSIAREAGCSPAAPYLYFDGKNDLLAALRAEGFRDLAERIERGVASAATPCAQLEAVIRAYLKFGVDRPELYRLMFELRQGESAKLPHVRDAREWAFGAARRVYARLVREGLARGGALTQTHLLWLNCHGLLSLHLAHQLDLGRDFESLVRPLVDHWTFTRNPNGRRRRKRHDGA
jgi:AcrR family transcriptional regulator